MQCLLTSQVWWHDLQNWAFLTALQWTRSALHWCLVQQSANLLMMCVWLAVFINKFKLRTEWWNKCNTLQSPFSMGRFQLTLRDHGYGATVSCCVHVYSPVFTGTDFTYMGGWAGWLNLSSSLNTKMVWMRLEPVNGHLRSINWANCRATSLIKTNILSVCQTPTWCSQV